MGLSENIARLLKRWIKPFFSLDKKQDYDFSIEEAISFQENLIENEMWVRGKAKELESYYKQIDVDNTSFWGSSSNIEKIRKIHVNLPSLIIKTLTDITVNDLNKIELSNEIYNQYWDSIEKDNKFKKNLNKVVKKVLIYGDGAFKISFNSNISQYPLIDFVDAKSVQYIYENGRYKETIFKKKYKANTIFGEKTLTLLEIYGFGYIKYKLVDDEFNEYPITTIDELKDLKDIVFVTKDNDIDRKINLAIPLKIWESEMWENRGKSIIEDKKQNFDSLDEIWSQFIDSIRKSRIQRYIPSNLLPKDKDGNILNKSDFANTYITLQNQGVVEEGNNDKVQLVEPTLQVDKYLIAYSTALDLCLEGILSGSTLGIDDNKLNNNSLAQREKEKITIYTRNNIIEALTDILQEVIETVLRFYCYQINEQYDETNKVDVVFGEYANSSFEALIETMSKAAGGKQVMSFEKIVDEIYADKLTQEEKDEEVARLKELNNVGIELDEPNLFNDVVDNMQDDEQDNLDSKDETNI